MRRETSPSNGIGEPAIGGLPVLSSRAFIPYLSSGDTFTWKLEGRKEWQRKSRNADVPRAGSARAPNLASSSYTQPRLPPTRTTPAYAPLFGTPRSVVLGGASGRSSEARIDDPSSARQKSARPEAGRFDGERCASYNVSRSWSREEA
ncbi:hypothetical protein KM043_006112 [Ampulex compressa]|nr:hypothetical protein KM043_006112 [Ampulex compressa]